VSTRKVCFLKIVQKKMTLSLIKFKMLSLVTIFFFSHVFKTNLQAISLRQAASLRQSIRFSLRIQPGAVQTVVVYCYHIIKVFFILFFYHYYKMNVFRCFVFEKKFQWNLIKLSNYQLIENNVDKNISLRL